MSDAIFDSTELTEFAKDFIDMANNKFPKQARSFVGKAGTKLKGRLKAAYKSEVHKETGALQKGVYRGKVYLYKADNAYEVRVGNRARHAHLIEKGHVIRNRKGGPSYGFVPGKKVLAKTSRSFDSELVRLAEDWVDELLTKGLF